MVDICGILGNCLLVFLERGQIGAGLGMVVIGLAKGFLDLGSEWHVTDERCNQGRSVAASDVDV